MKPEGKVAVSLPFERPGQFFSCDLFPKNIQDCVHIIYVSVPHNDCVLLTTEES